MTLELINGTWCRPGDPYFTPILQSGEFNDRWVLDQALLHVKQRRLALDIGAHIGLWSRELAREFGFVVAFEPDPENFAALGRNLTGVTNVRALWLAVAPRSGRFCLSHEGTINSGEGFLTPLINGESDWVVGLKLDDANFTNVDLVKIDIEGLEALVLAGGEQMICANRPVVVLEESFLGVRYGGQVGDARRLLEGWGMAEVARREFIPGGFDVVMAWP